jgi:hypothetical protein
MVTQKLVTEEAWYIIWSSSWIQEYDELAESILERMPDATSQQLEKALLKLREVILKKSGYVEVNDG